MLTLAPIWWPEGVFASVPKNTPYMLFSNAHKEAELVYSFYVFCLGHKCVVKRGGAALQGNNKRTK